MLPALRDLHQQGGQIHLQRLHSDSLRGPSLCAWSRCTMWPHHLLNILRFLSLGVTSRVMNKMSGMSEWSLTLRFCGFKWILGKRTIQVNYVGPMIPSWIGTMVFFVPWIGARVRTTRMRNSTFELFQLVNWWCLIQVPILASCPIISLDVEFPSLVAKQSWKMPKENAFKPLAGDLHVWSARVSTMTWW